VGLFIRLTILVALAIVALTVIGFVVIHVLLPAALIAAVIIGVVAAIGYFRRLTGRNNTLVRR